MRSSHMIRRRTLSCFGDNTVKPRNIGLFAHWISHCYSPRTTLLSRSNPTVQRIFSTASSTLSTAMMVMPSILCLGALALGMIAWVNPNFAASFKRS